MKNLLVVFCLVTLCYSCKQKEEKVLSSPELSTAEKIANAHGFEHWKNVSEIHFTFNKKRNWTWNPKTDDVTLTTEKDTINYNRKSIDSISLKADRGFINDKFWLLIPFQLVWDSGTTISDPIKETAPISKIEMNKITLLYSSEGGYTPGDAYDIYFEDDYIIKEWAFRRGNKPQAGLTNTFENYHNYNGIKMASDHKNGKGDWNLTLTDIKVKTN
ncbi:hypothetical protein [Algibacter aquimarinus]|uniref:Uncharacterized protein n=1 Tax=Algibacter aquimarinus TaxID=1136748 RepID=A0ABP9H7U7_9FLAO